MGTKIEYVESSHLYATNYIRNSKAIAVLWAIFTICYAIISTVAFLTPGKNFLGFPMLLVKTYRVNQALMSPTLGFLFIILSIIFDLKHEFLLHDI